MANKQKIFSNNNGYLETEAKSDQSFINLKVR